MYIMFSYQISRELLFQIYLTQDYSTEELVNKYT